MGIQRVDRGKGHSYIDTDTGDHIPGVTTILSNGIPKPALVKWAGDATAEYAIDQWSQLADLPPSARLKELQGARYAVKDAAANKGTRVHALAERLVNGERVTVPDELAGHVASYVRFLDEFDVQPVLVEATVWSQRHNYCGTLDLIANLLDPDNPGQYVRWLLDLKTNRSGIFGETALQLAAYRYADYCINGDDPDAMIEVDRVGAVHVRANGYDLIPLEAGPAQHRLFLYAQQIAQFTEHGRDLVGDPITSPTGSTYRLVRDE